MTQNAGTQAFVANGSVGTSGVAVRVFCLSYISTATPAVVSLRNGTSTGAQAYVTSTGTASTGVVVIFGDKGMVFPAGCFVHIDANTTVAVVTYNSLS